MKKSSSQLLVFIIDRHGRALTKKSSHRLLTELSDKALVATSIDAIVVNGSSANNSKWLESQLAGRRINTWEIIYLHGDSYPPVLLTKDDKEKLVALLPDFVGTSAEAIYKILDGAGTYHHFILHKN